MWSRVVLWLDAARVRIARIAGSRAATPVPGLFGLTHFGELPCLCDGMDSRRANLDAIATTFCEQHALQIRASNDIPLMSGKYYDLGPVRPVYATYRDGRQILAADYRDAAGLFVGDGSATAAFAVEEVLEAVGCMLGMQHTTEMAVADMLRHAATLRAWGVQHVCAACGWQQAATEERPLPLACPRCGGQVAERQVGPLASRSAGAT